MPYREFNNNRIQSFYTGRFIMFSVITNIYNKKTKRPTLMDFSQPHEN